MGRDMLIARVILIGKKERKIMKGIAMRVAACREFKYGAARGAYRRNPQGILGTRDWGFLFRDRG